MAGGSFSRVDGREELFEVLHHPSRSHELDPSVGVKGIAQQLPERKSQAIGVRREPVAGCGGSSRLGGLARRGR